MTRAVYLAGGGLCCTAGSTPAAVAEALANSSGRLAASALSLGERRFPYAALPGPLPQDADDWLRRAEAACRRAVAPLGALPGDVPLFFASSSFQIGHFEAQPAPRDLPPACASFVGRVAGWLGLDGVRHSFSNACISGQQAIQAAAAQIADGSIDDALVLGCELYNRSTAAGFAGMGLLSPTACRPFDRDRDGLVLGEAVAALQLSARPAGWRLAAVDSALDAFSPTGPTPDGSRIAALLSACLAEAALPPADIDLVKLHAAGSPTNDPAEANALRTVFGNAMPPLCSLKGSLGHALGASGVVETVALLACLDAGFVPPTAGFVTPDPEISLQPAVDRSNRPVRRVLLNGIGFGGGLAAMIVERSA